MFQLSTSANQRKEIDMGFFSTSDGQEIVATGEYDMGGGSFDPIPDGTRVRAVVENVAYDEHENRRNIKITWQVLEPAAYAKRKIFQKLEVFHFDTKKADKAKRMLAAIDANAGGKIAKLGREPTDQDLMDALLMKSMLLKLLVWEMNGKTGNWVAQVSSKETVSQAPAPTVQVDNDDIPF